MKQHEQVANSDAADLAAKVIGHDTDTVVQVDGLGPRGGARVWTVQFSRRGHIRSAYQHEPAGGFLDAGRVPPDVREAARRCYQAAGFTIS